MSELFYTTGAENDIYILKCLHLTVGRRASALEESKMK